MKKNGGKISGGKTGQREGGNKRHVNNSDAIAKQFKIKI
jgi:hypothetical protein